jgi:hypothetical protein
MLLIVCLSLPVFVCNIILELEKSQTIERAVASPRHDCGARLSALHSNPGGPSAMKIQDQPGRTRRRFKMNNSREYMKVFLKICEGCGVLWLRSEAANGVYCYGCASKLAEFPPPNPGKCRNRRIRMAGERATRHPQPRCHISSGTKNIHNGTAKLLMGGAQ